MHNELAPRVAIPPPIRGADPDSFAKNTVKVRLPEIARRILEENALTSERELAMRQLIGKLPEGPLRPLKDLQAPDAAAWNAYIEQYVGWDWLEIPWFFAETHFYRRVAEAVDFFRPGSLEVRDPFSLQKRIGLETTRGRIRELASHLHEVLSAGGYRAETFAGMLEADLWGNQADLSLWPAGEGAGPDHASREAARAYLLKDDAPEAARLIDDREQLARVDLIADNAGYELAGDLALIDYLLTAQKVGAVILHAKLHPTFVSDALSADVLATIAFFRDDDHRALRDLGSRLDEAVRAGRLVLQDDAYWTSPLAGWEMPPTLRTMLAGSDLIISKGDANYRRFLGDRHWDFTTAFADVVCYMPAPLLCLRTLKSEIVVGLAPEQIALASSLDPAWLVDGRWGVIQLYTP